MASGFNPLVPHDPTPQGPAANPMLAAGVSAAGSAVAGGMTAARDWLMRERQKSVDMGLLDANTGLPTADGLKFAGMAFANGLGDGGVGAAVGTIKNALAAKGWPRDVSESIAEKLRSNGFEATPKHSKNDAGYSSYMTIVDPSTGRYIPEVRISDHHNGPANGRGVSHYRSPDEAMGLLSEADAMRAQGPTDYWRSKTSADRRN